MRIYFHIIVARLLFANLLFGQNPESEIYFLLNNKSKRVDISQIKSKEMLVSDDSVFEIKSFQCTNDTFGNYKLLNRYIKSPFNKEKDSLLKYMRNYPELTLVEKIDSSQIKETYQKSIIGSCLLNCQFGGNYILLLEMRSNNRIDTMIVGFKNVTNQKFWIDIPFKKGIYVFDVKDILIKKGGYYENLKKEIYGFDLTPNKWENNN